MRLTDITPLILSLWICAEIHAQAAPTAAPTRAVVRHQPTGYIRVWHFAPNLKTPVSVSLSGGGSPKPLILARALMRSDIMNYREVPVGQLKLSVRQGASDFSVSDANPEVLLPVTITVEDNSYQTIILQDEGRSTKLLVSKDNTGTDVPHGGKRLRIFNFAPGRDASLRIVPKNEVISAHVPTGLSQHIFPSNPGSLTLIMSNKLPNGYEAEQNIDADFSRADSISALLLIDKYGRLELQARQDAKTD